MRSWTIAFSLGIFVCGFIPWIPSSPQTYLCLIAPLLSLKFSSLRLLGAYSIGIFWFLLWAQSGLDNLLAQDLENQEIWVRGKIISLPQQADSSQRFELLTENKQKLLLNFYEPMPIKPGQHWQLKVKLKRPHGFSNPGGFDYEAWLFQNEINATGYVRSDPNNRLLNDRTSFVNFQSLRFSFREKLEALSKQGEKPLANIGLIKALSIGDRYNISDEEWDLFTATGTNHLIVISGLHVGLVSFLVYRLSIFLFSFCGRLLLIVPAKRLAGFMAIFAAFIYAGLAGFSLPAQRAFVMVAIFMLGQCFYRHTSIYNTYCLTLALVLALDPLAPQSSGFWLSFGAVGVLILFAGRPRESVEKMSLLEKSLALIKTQGFLFVGLFPLMLFFFHQVSLLAPVVNIIAIPFISLLVVPVCLAGLVCIPWFPALATLLFTLADYLLQIFKDCLTIGLEYSGSSLVELPALNPIELTLLGGGILVLLFLPNDSRRNKLLKILSLGCFIPLIMSKQAAIAKGSFHIEVLDVGQGLALVISTQSHHLIYDTGPVYSPRFSAGSGIVLPYLLSQNITGIDKIMVSHGDQDHSGGLAALSVNFPKAHYLSSDTSLFGEHLQADTCRKEQSWLWDEVKFEILHPDEKTYDSNNASCVLKVSSGEFSILLSGDIEQRVERMMVSNQSDKLEADILLAPHHGSLTSSTKVFIEAVSPEYVIFSAGYLNRFNHPHPKVVERYSDSGIRILNTAETGALSIHISAKQGISTPIGYRSSRQRYWSSL